ncbi:sigma-54 interaction domain-containing protein [Thiorhodococcus minor]|uniref:AAA domain-containing protein n=1 Tax=Thiorhodococcus minor TaxID=57489 RepID=A0A6M0JS67_9GAMM|nr:sigma 54-interacting transcriptional regulator [Thiorhodococcus minor]NEV60378.1 AAA domain-containing protein [Thiorhodococcus minor]
MDRILVSWIGRKDLEARTRSREHAEAQGPVLSTLLAERFGRAELIYNYETSEVEPYLDWLGEQCTIPLNSAHAQLTTPVHFGEIYQAVDAWLTQVTERYPDHLLCILLSPGTPAMQAVWILLGKTKYPAVFFQSSIEQGVQQVDIPFDISAEFLPQLTARSNRQLGKLAVAEVPIAAAFDDILTRDPVMEGLIAQANIVARRDVPVLIQGETGTGKELFATAIHNASNRREKHFVAVNCGAIPRDLIDASLFGHVKGAFTGAAAAKPGYFEAADGGTLFLDEIGELPLDAQVRLLRVLQSGDFYPVGGATAKRVDVRVIAATNRNLMDEVTAGRFREDLFYRIAVGVLRLPPLRDRPTDILLLADFLLDRINLDAAGQPGFSKKALSVKARNAIKQHHWPGNVRELYSTLLRASLWSFGERIEAPDIDAALFRERGASEGILGRRLNEDFDIQSVLDEVVQHYAGRALEQANNNRTQAAKLLGLGSYQTLNNWMNKHQVKIEPG